MQSAQPSGHRPQQGTDRPALAELAQRNTGEIQRRQPARKRRLYTDLIGTQGGIDEHNRPLIDPVRHTGGRIAYQRSIRNHHQIRSGDYAPFVDRTVVDARERGNRGASPLRPVHRRILRVIAFEKRRRPHDTARGFRALPAPAMETNRQHRRSLATAFVHALFHRFFAGMNDRLDIGPALIQIMLTPLDHVIERGARLLGHHGRADDEVGLHHRRVGVVEGEHVGDDVLELEAIAQDAQVEPALRALMERQWSPEGHDSKEARVWAEFIARTPE